MYFLAPDDFRMERYCGKYAGIGANEKATLKISLDIRCSLRYTYLRVEGFAPIVFCGIAIDSWLVSTRLEAVFAVLFFH